MPASVFVSHSFADGTAAAKRLSESLASDKGLSIWSPTQEMRLGQSWLDQVSPILSTVDAVLLIMTKDALAFHSACRTECISAQSLGKPIIPIRMSRVTLYPSFVLPFVVWVDLVEDFNKGLRRLKNEIFHIQSSGAPRNVIPPSTWDPGDGIFQNHPGFLVGQWIFKRRMKPKEKYAYLPEYDLIMYPTYRYRERIHTPILNRRLMSGTWAVNAHDSSLMLSQDDGAGRVMSIDTHIGPNWFGGITDGRRYVAERMLELE